MAAGEQQRASAPRTVDTDPAESQVVPAEWTIPPKLVKRYGDLNLQQLHAWWLAWGPSMVQGSTPVVFVSGIQLFIQSAHWLRPPPMHFHSPLSEVHLYHGRSKVTEIYWKDTRGYGPEP